MKKKLIVFSCFLCLSVMTSLTGCGKENILDNDLTATDYGSVNNTSNKNKKNSNKSKKPSPTDDATIHTDDVEIDITPDSYTVLVNKEYGLPLDYTPDDLVVPNIAYSFSYYDEKKQLRKVPAAALEKLVSAASEEGLAIKGVSGYRSYSRQKTIYNNNIRTKGLQHTQQYSAKPGFSEHQTGLSIDVSSSSANYSLSSRFGTTAEGQWLAKNCAKFGFIIRYPEGKEHITGYSYEPWHIRYVGIELATYLTEHNLTLEEYYNYTPTYTNAPEKNTHDNDLEEIPKSTATPKAYTSTPMATMRPTSTPMVTKEPTSTPITTKEPVNTPIATMRPTSTPIATKKPANTPTVTKKPVSTPVVTKKPVSTSVATKKPTNTPTATKKPVSSSIATKKPVPTPDHVQEESTGDSSASDTSEGNPIE